MTPSGARKALLKLSGANMLKKKDHACNWCEVQKVLRSIPKYKTRKHVWISFIVYMIEIQLLHFRLTVVAESLFSNDREHPIF